MSNFHSQQSPTNGGVHGCQAYQYADATARLAATGFTAADVGKIARQDLPAPPTFWLLTNHSPITWEQFGASAPPAAHALGGAQHSSDTLANLNAKVNDATLIDGPGTSTDEALARYDGTAGKLQDSGWALTDAGILYPVSGADLGQAANRINDIYLGASRTIDFATMLTLLGGNVRIGHTFTSPYRLSIQRNTDECWMEILNNGGADKGAFFGMYLNDFELYNWQGGHMNFYTDEVAAGYELRFQLTNDGQALFKGRDDVTYPLTIRYTPGGNLELTRGVAGFCQFMSEANYPQLMMGAPLASGAGYIDMENSQPLYLNALHNGKTYVGSAGCFPENATTPLGSKAEPWAARTTARTAASSESTPMARGKSSQKAGPMALRRSGLSSQSVATGPFCSIVSTSEVKGMAFF